MLLLCERMMMFTPNSLFRQKEEAEGEEEEEVEGRRKAGPTGTPPLSADASISTTRSGVSDSRNRRKHGRWSGVPIHRRAPVSMIHIQ